MTAQTASMYLLLRPDQGRPRPTFQHVLALDTTARFRIPLQLLGENFCQILQDISRPQALIMALRDPIND